MGYCTGSGEANGDHCCYTGANPDGTQRVCPHLMNNAQILAWIDAQPWGNTKKVAARNFVANIVWSCRIAINVLADGSPALRRNRAQYETAFLAHPDYNAFPRPFFQQMGVDDCVKWQGEPTEGGTRTCCYRRTDAECDADSAQKGITGDALTIRRAGRRVV